MTSTSNVSAGTMDGFVELPPDFLNFTTLMQRKGLGEWKLSQEHVRAVVEVLYAVVVQAYSGSMETLVRRSHNANENTRFSGALTRELNARGWKAPTKEKYLHSLKRILSETPVSESFVSTLKLEKAKAQYNRILGKKHSSETATPAIKERLEAWVALLREETGSKTMVSLRTIISFYVNQCLPQLELELERWPAEPQSAVMERLHADPALVETICGPPGTGLAKKKATWLRIFLNDIIKIPHPIPDAYFAKPVKPESDDAMTSDAHRISSEALETMYAQSKLCVRDELIFLLFITTGLRIGGVSKIRVDAVVDVLDDVYVARTQGRTKEKGGKWTSFCLTKRVQTLVEDWLKNHRPASSSPCLFPGTAAEHVHTETIRCSFHKLCARAGLSGKEYHPHALRHTFAHLLLETGNSVDVVAKCLNHSSSQVTEKFYLKENIEEVTNRAVIPWLPELSKKRVAPLPAFLDEGAQTGKQKQVAKKQKLNQTLSSLDLL